MGLVNSVRIPSEPKLQPKKGVVSMPLFSGVYGIVNSIIFFCILTSRLVAEASVAIVDKRFQSCFSYTCQCGEKLTISTVKSRKTIRNRFYNPKRVGDPGTSRCQLGILSQKNCNQRSRNRRTI